MKLLTKSSGTKKRNMGDGKRRRLRFVNSMESFGLVDTKVYVRIKILEQS